MWEDFYVRRIPDRDNLLRFKACEGGDRIMGYTIFNIYALHSNFNNISYNHSSLKSDVSEEIMSTPEHPTYPKMFVQCLHLLWTLT